MFNIGGGEFLVIAAIALIVLGPQRLPEAARTVGKVMGELRRISSGFQQELKGALDDAELRAGAEGSADAAAAGAPAPQRSGAEQKPPASSNGTAPKGKPAPRREAPLRAAPVSKDARPRTKGA